jgi:GH25 family lysozyme M1 (1,4-beta-N-acetylmuramidase)
LRKIAAGILAIPVITSIYIAALVALLAARRTAAVTIASVAIAIIAVSFALPRLNPARPRLAAVQQDRTSSAGPAAVAPSDVSVGAARQAVPSTSAQPTTAVSTTSGSVASPTAPRTQAMSGVGRRPASRSRSMTTLSVSGTELSTTLLRPGSRIELHFNRPVAVDGVRTALVISPPVAGRLRAINAMTYDFVPTSPLAPGTVYTIRMAHSVLDSDGVAVARMAPTQLRTVPAPTLVAFQPATGSTGISRSPQIGVVFSRPMDTAVTGRAFKVIVANHSVAGSISWSGHGIRLVFVPRVALAAGAHVGVRLFGTAASADGAPIAHGGSATFKVIPASAPSRIPAAHVPTAQKNPTPSRPTKPVGVRPKPRPPTSPGHRPSPGSLIGTILGVDVSHHEGQIDWASVAGSGKKFAYLKASEGTGYVDPTYALNRAAATAVGLRTGAFHYAQPDSTPGEAAAEADHFAQVAAIRRGDLRPMLDLEVRNGLSASELQGWIAAFLDRLYARTGVRAGIYVSPAFWSSYVGDSAPVALSDGAQLWIAHWTTADAPSLPASDWAGHGWTVWQYTDHGRVPGIAVPADVDRVTAARFSSLVVP